MAVRQPLIIVYLVTCRRNEMLRRALASVLGQTHRHLLVKVVNDDPDDLEVARIVASAGDDRASLFQPVRKRGGTRNFNLVFEETEGDFVSLLEDDNWWEPGFLEEMLGVLQNHPDHALVIGNERIWRETAEGGWCDTQKTIWSHQGVRTHDYTVEEICGSAKLCNSSMLVRVDRAQDLRTPDTIPLDVTEHFRERLLTSQVLLNGAPLVNFAVTLQTARSARDETWGAYQSLLIGSVFIAAASPRARRSLARRLWSQDVGPTSPRGVTLVATGFAVREARSLVWEAPMLAWARFALWLARRPNRLKVILKARQLHNRELAFLVQAPLTQTLAARLI